ncbi:MAG: hypothetical protein AB1432_13280 [Bacteroidota bacterium]
MKNINSILLIMFVYNTIILSQKNNYNINTLSVSHEINQKQSIYEFNPLHVGNVWQYRFEDTPVYCTPKIRDTADV